MAIDPPGSVCEQLAVWAREAVALSGLAGPARAARLIGPQALHLTLCFLGSRPVEEIEALGEALEDSRAVVEQLSVGAPLWLPPRRPRALAVAVRDRGESLASLQAGVVTAISQMVDWQPERRGFRAHITLARLGRDAAAPRGEPHRALELPATPRLGFTPRTVVLYRSRLAPSGATYEALARFEL